MIHLLRSIVLPAVVAGAALPILAACAAAPATAPSPALDRTALIPTFVEDFARPPSFFDPQLAPKGRWKTNFFFSFQETDHPRGWEARTLRPNKELQYYEDPLRGGTSFAWKPGELTIVGRPSERRGDPATNGQPYLSGLITTEKSFNQRYGYFEARVLMPVGKGLWPAFWLMPEAKYVGGQLAPIGQQEIDIFENVGDRDRIYATVHRDESGRKVADGGAVPVDRIDRWHDYGVLWTKDSIAWYVDGREVRRRPNRDFHMPAYMLLNLAIGGEWPGSPDATTPFPARMKIAWVRGYALKSSPAAR